MNNRYLNNSQWLCLLWWWSIVSWKSVNSALYFTTNSEFGIFMAISVPIGLPHRNVFLSYNYEFNYYQPEHVYKYPPILMGDFEDSYLTYPTSGRGDSGRHCQNCTERRDQKGDTNSNSNRDINRNSNSNSNSDSNNDTNSDSNSNSNNDTNSDSNSNSNSDSDSDSNSNSNSNNNTNSNSNSTTEADSESKTRGKRSLSLMNRSIFYSMISDKLKRSGYPAEACLLRLICETNASQLGEVNGFLGSLIHIIFTPSSSKDEHLPDEFYQAEWQGHHQRECTSYSVGCEANILDLISVPVEQALSDIVSGRKRK